MLNKEGEMDGERIPQEVLDAAHRRLCREVAAVIASTMAETDTGWEMVAAKTDRSVEYWKAWFMTLLDGTNTDELRSVSRLGTAMGRRVEIEFIPLPSKLGARLHPEQEQEAGTP